MTKCTAPIVGGRKEIGVPEHWSAAEVVVGPQGDGSLGDFCEQEGVKVRALRPVLLIFLTLDMWNSDQSQESYLPFKQSVIFFKM